MKFINKFNKMAIFILALFLPVVFSGSPCKTNEDCQGKWSTSVCDEGLCTNVFAELGCLTTIAKDRNDDRYNDIIKPRVCNSDDGDDASLSCRRIKEDVAFGEVRIAAADWESTIINSWIYQIMLSEILDVPTTIETGDKEDLAGGSFYDGKNRFVIGKESYPFEYLKESTRLEEEGEICNSRSEKPCAHLITELWDGALKDAEQAQDDGYVLLEQSDGFVGTVGLYITQFTVKNDPSLISYFGLRGPSNRKKLAETFKTPTNWGDYCSEVSNCTRGDDVATREPSGEDEAKSYFFEESYTGYFRQLEENNCTIYPDTCSGNFVNPRCGWTTYAEGQMHWQNISLKSTGPLEPNNGYDQKHMTEIWMAANATKSDLIMWWWSPSLFKEKFAGTQSEFQRITFSVPTDECVQYRQTIHDKCSNDPNVRIGDEIGSCDYQMFTIQKAISKGLEIMVGDDVENLLRSPALDFLQDVEIPAFAMDAILADFSPNGYPEHFPRDIVCNWVYDNLDYLQTHIPFGFPRTFDQSHLRGGNIQIAAIVISSFALCWVFTIAVLVIRWRATMLVKLAKIDILIWVLIGATIVVIGSLATAIGITDASCMVSKWTTLLGYAIELVPIIIKVGTINRLVRVARQQQPFDLKAMHLDLYLLGTILSILIYLVLATAIDPIKVKTVPVLYPDNNVHVHGTCSSKSFGWVIVDFGFQAVILIIATVLVFQSRDVFERFNEGQGLTLMVFSHSVFLMMRIVAERLQSTSLDRFSYISIASILKSLDITLATSFYFGQKFISIWSSNKNIAVPPASDSLGSLQRNVWIGNSPRTQRTLKSKAKRLKLEQNRAHLKTLRRKKSEQIQSLNLPADSNGDIVMPSISVMSPCFGLERLSVSNGEGMATRRLPVPEEDPQCTVRPYHQSPAHDLRPVSNEGIPSSSTMEPVPEQEFQ